MCALVTGVQTVALPIYQLARLVALGPTRVRVALDCGFDGEYTSQNVIGEITGSERPDEVVLLGGHLDSWDLGTGAIDDAAGIAITMATGALLKPLEPKRTVRVVRSEEHTSELQSLMRISYAVLCLQKKNKNNNPI